MTLEKPAPSGRRVGFDLDVQADFVADEGDSGLHAEFRAVQRALRVGAAAALADRQVEAALEARDLQPHRPDFAEQNQFAFDGYRPRLCKNVNFCSALRSML